MNKILSKVNHRRLKREKPTRCNWYLLSNVYLYMFRPKSKSPFQLQFFLL